MEKQLQPKLRFSEFNEDWERKSFDEVCEFINGRAYKQQELLTEGKYRVLRVGNFFSNKEWYYSDLELEDNKYVEYGDLMYAWSASFGPRFWNDDKTIYHYHIWKVITKPVVNRNFLYQILDNETNKLLQKKQGGTMFHITKGAIEKVNSSFPELSEQLKIADYLSTIDAKIILLEEKKTELSRYKKAMMQKLFSQEIRFKDENGNDFSDWEEKRLGEVASFNVLKNKANLILPVLTNSAEYGVVNQEDFFDNQIANDKSLDSYIVLDKNEFVYNPRISKHAPFGPININKLEKGLLSPLYSVFKIREDLMNLVYVEYYFKTSKWYKYMAISGNQGARSDRMAVNKETLNNIPISKPSFPEQQKIADFLSAIDESMDNVSEQIKETQSFKKAMLQQMFV